MKEAAGGGISISSFPFSIASASDGKIAEESSEAPVTRRGEEGKSTWMGAVVGVGFGKGRDAVASKDDSGDESRDLRPSGAAPARHIHLDCNKTCHMAFSDVEFGTGIEP